MAYQKMYYLLFNAITDALSEMEAMNFGAASETLKQAQINAEALYVEYDEKNGEGTSPPRD